MDTISLWESITKHRQKYPTLDHDIAVDVAIIGGGITGLTAAWHLIQSGKKVAVLEASSIGGGTTGYSTGNLYVAVQPYFQKLASKFDEEIAKKVAMSRKHSIDYIEKIVQENKIECNFTRRPWYMYATKKEEIEFFDREFAILKKMGLGIELVDTLPLPLKIKKAAIMKDQARFNPLQYVISLAALLKEKGCLIFENSRVINIEETDDCLFHTENAKITAQKGIIATHTPIGINPIQIFTAPYRSYVVAAELKDNQYPEGNFWNLTEPHYATSTHSMKGTTPDILAVAGSHHKTGQSKNANAHFQELENYLQQNYAIAKIIYRWSAQHYHAADGIPYIGLVGHSAKHTYQATGYFADGLVYGTLAGILIGDEILARDNDWKHVYNSNRLDIVASAGFFIKENANIFAQYMKDFPCLGNEKVAEVKPGEGKVIDIKGEKCGVFRDDHNAVHVVSAVCPHMKCIVNWNNAEQTWDCPCHGSRFSFDGKYIEGPAMSDLERKIEFKHE